MSSHKDFIKKLAIVNRTKLSKEEQEFLKSPKLNLAHHPIPEPDAATITPNRILQLQRLIGNYATSSILGNHSVIQRGGKHTKDKDNQDKKKKKEKKQNDLNFNFDEVAMEVSDGYDHNQIQDQLIAYIKDSKKDVGVRLMAKKINKIMQLITNKDFEVAYLMLISNNNLEKIKYTLDDDNQLDISTDNDLETTLQSPSAFMHFPDKRKIKITDIDFEEHGHFLKHPQVDVIGPIILATMLEEWIHAFQNLIKGHLSESIQDFKEFTKLNDGEFELNGWSLNELDIFVIYQALGWDNLLDTFAGRYEERGAYREYVEKKTGQVNQNNHNGHNQ